MEAVKLKRYRVSGYCENCHKVVVRLNADDCFGYWDCPECGEITEMEV